MRNIFFDLDGTLVDSLPGIEYAVDCALRESNFVRREPLRSLIGPPIRDILQSVAAGATEDQLDRLEAAFRAVYDSAGWRQTALQSGAARALDVLLAGGMRLFLVTNKPLAATAKILSLLGLEDHFEDVLARNSTVPPFTSKARMLQYLLERHGLDPKQCLMVGDTTEDCAAAAEAGVAAVIMAHGYGQQWAAPSGCLLLNDFRELTSLCVENRGNL